MWHPNPTAVLPATNSAAADKHQRWNAPIPQATQQKAATHLDARERRGYSNAHGDYRLMGAYNRSFTTPAVITLVLYFVLWIPGLIANIFYLIEANKVERLTGETPEGKGCLLAMLVFGALCILIICVVWLVIIGAIGSSARGTEGRPSKSLQSSVSQCFAEAQNIRASKFHLWR